MRMNTYAGDPSERDRLVVAHIGLVKAMAQRLARRLPPQVDVSDLVSIGVLGLIEAAGRYQASTGVPFDAFARRRVQGAMLDELRGLDTAPRSLRKMRRHVDGTIAQLRTTLGHEPSEAEIAFALEMTEAKYGEVFEQLRMLELAQVRQLEEFGSDHTPLLDVCVDPDEGPEVKLQRSEFAAITSTSCKLRGNIPKPMVPFWDNKLPRWSAWGFMFRAVKPLIHHRY